MMKAKEIDIIPTKDVFVGDPKAPVTLMEYGDYESEACAKVNEIVDKLLKQFQGKMRFNFRHFPLTKVHQHAMKAAEASLGAAQEGKFWEMHTTLFANRRRLGAISLREYAKECGVINKKFLENLVDSTSWLASPQRPARRARQGSSGRPGLLYQWRAFHR
ncbi:DsbA family protein [Puia sp. P3]|uniref:DsbA family protein n=1 Tax=Puia sp. P3 TaxID=3423952 RepID=UPI003D674486